MLLRSADISAPAVIRSRLRVVSTVQRTVRRGLRWYLAPAVARVTTHNRAVAEVVEAHRRELASMRVDVERLDHDVTLLGLVP